MLIERGVVKVGMEVEIAKWKEGRTFRDVCYDLVDAEYMLPPKEQWDSHHNYHCKCVEGGCNQVRRGDVIVPPIVSMTYDASLPKSGAEFIMSPVILGDDGLYMLRDIWDIVVRDAIWDNTSSNWNGDGNCSPSVHLHVSATLRDQDEYIPGPQWVNMRDDIIHALSLFSPELFAIADLAGYRRGLKFRLPTRNAIHNDPTGGGHHGFIQVRKAIPQRVVYLEWRLFEAAYNEWEYIEACAFLAAVITRGFLHKQGLRELMSVGYTHLYDEERMNQAIETDNTSFILEQVNSERLYALRELSLSMIDDNPRGYDMVSHIFNRVEGTIL